MWDGEPTSLRRRGMSTITGQPDGVYTSDEAAIGEE
jgi:hypothetical protein